MRTGILMGAAVVIAVVIAAVTGFVAQQRPSAAVSYPAAARSDAMAEPFDSDQPPSELPIAPLEGRVREVIEVAQYTYLRLGTDQGEVWAAVSKAPVVVGSDVTVEDPAKMERFESVTLKRTFDVIYFGNLPTSGAATTGKLPPGHPSVDHGSSGPAGELPAGHPSVDGTATMPPMHGGPGAATPANAGTDVVVPRASGSNAHTIGDLFAQSTKLEGKRVRVRGQVVKVTAGVQGKTYLRLRDGSGARPEERELVVTSQAEARVGEVTTFEGTLRTQVDVGIGFRYPILLSDAQVIDDSVRDKRSAGER
jgi:hypothetical protein